MCTVSLDMGRTLVRDRYVEHYYLIYSGLYFYMVGLILWVVCILYLTYKLLKKVVNYVYELQAATGKLFDKSVDYIELSPELSEIAININRLKQEAENNARLAQENEQRKNDLIMYLAHDLKTPLSSVIGYLTLLHDDEQQISQELREKYLSISLDKAERLEDLINEEDEKPSARNRNRRNHHRYDIYQDTNGARKNAITTFWLVLGLIILIVGFILIICNIKNQLLIALSILGLVFISYAVMSRGFDKDD